jgi:anti-sigma B factor antagonist
MAVMDLPRARPAAPGSRAAAEGLGGPADLAVCERWEDGVATVTVRGEIDLVTVEEFAERLGEVARRGPRRLVINLAGVRFVDSTGLHAFVRVRRELPEPCPVILRSPRSQVRRVFDVTGLSPVFVFE